MNQKNLLMVTGIFAALLIILSPGVFATSYIELNVFPSQVSMCPCSAVTPQSVAVTVKNLHHSTDTIKFTLDAPPGWSSQIQPDVTLASGEETRLDLFLINVDCSVAQGPYTATITAESLTRGEKVNKDLQIDVLLCRGAELTVDDKAKETCIEEPVPATYDMNIKNLGKFEETYEISASVSWAGFSESEITVGPGEAKDFSVVLNPEGLLLGTHKVMIYAKSTDTNSPNYYTPATQEIEIVVKECYDFTVDLQPKENVVCFGKSAEYILVIENTGLKEDTFSIFTPSNWVEAKETEVTLGAGNKANVKVTATPETTGTHEVMVTVTSEKDTSNSKKASSLVSSQECRSVAVIVTPTEQKVCSGLPPVNFDVSVKNIGTIGATYSLTTTLGVLADSELTLDAGETKATILTVPLDDLEGTTTVTVKAADDGIYDEESINLIVENCYSAELIIEPEVQSVCPYDTASYTITLKNTGKLEDNYTLRYGDETEDITLGPDESESYELTFLVPFEESGVYVVSAFADSEHVSLTATAALNVKPMQDCYNAEIKVEEKVCIKPCTMETCETTTVDVQIINTGEKPVLYNISIVGPEWTYMEPTQLDLDSNETGNAYVYLSPNFDTEERSHTLTIGAVSEYVNKIQNFEVIVSNDTSDCGTVEPPEPPDGECPGGGIGCIIGGEIPIWKSLIVIVIALAIIIILALRFVLLVRK